MLRGMRARASTKLTWPPVNQDPLDLSLTIEETDDDDDEHQEAQGPYDGALDPLEQRAVGAGETRRRASAGCW